MPHLESSFDEFMQVANESLISRKRSVDQLLASAEKRLRRKLKTIGDCDDFLQIIKNEGAKFNECIRTLISIKKKYDNGKYEKRDYQDQLRSAMTLLKKNCNRLQVNLGNIVDDTRNVTKQDLKDFNKYITGLKKIVTDIRKDLVKKKRATAKESTLYDEYDEILDGVLEEAFDLTKLVGGDDDDDKKKKKDDDTDDSESDFKGESLDDVDDDTDDDDKKKKKKKSKKKKDDDDDDSDSDDDKDKDDDDSDDDDDKDEDEDDDDKDDDDDSDNSDSDDDSDDDSDSDDDDEDKDDSEDDDDDDKKKSKKKKKKSKKSKKKDDDDDSEDDSDSDDDSDNDSDDSSDSDDSDNKESKESAYYSRRVTDAAIEMTLRNPNISFQQALDIIDTAEDSVLEDPKDRKAMEMAEELEAQGVPLEKALEMAYDYLEH